MNYLSSNKNQWNYQLKWTGKMREVGEKNAFVAKDKKKPRLGLRDKSSIEWPGGAHLTFFQCIQFVPCMLMHCLSSRVAVGISNSDLWCNKKLFVYTNVPGDVREWFKCPCKFFYLQQVKTHTNPALRPMQVNDLLFNQSNNSHPGANKQTTVDGCTAR